MKLINKILIYSLVGFMTLILLAFFIKGDEGEPLAYQSKIDTKVGSPFESTNSTSRYALTQALVENGTVFLSESLAKASAPDLVYYEGKFISIFTPGVSFAAVPFYKLGQLYNMPQLFTYLFTTIVAFINMFLVMAVAKRLGAKSGAALLAGLIFLFATNALAYALTLTQHHLSITVLLLSFLTVTGRLGVLQALAFGAFVGIGALLDIPNPMLLAPLGIYYALRHFSFIRQSEEKVKLAFNLRIIAVLIGILPFIGFFGWYNHQTTGSYTLIGQNIGRSNYFDSAEKQRDDAAARLERQQSTEHQSSLPFRSRRQLMGFYTLLVSDERSWLFYSPIVLFGILGISHLYRKKETQTLSILVASVVGLNIVLYGMFTDPWGGWSFGPRYLLPAAAFLCSALGVAITAYIRHLWFLIPFTIVLIYSIFISVAGALTTAAIPPKVEAVNLSKPTPYTYDYNFQLLEQNISSSLFFNLVASYNLTAQQYYLWLSLILSGLLGGFGTALYLKTKMKGIKA